MWNIRLNTEQIKGKQNANLTDEETPAVTSPPLQKTWHFLLGPTMGPKWKLNWRFSANKQQVTKPIQTPPAHQILMYWSSVKSTKPAQHKLCGLFYVYCSLVRIAENFELWHPEWDPRKRVLKLRVPNMAKIAKKLTDTEIKSTKPAEKEVWIATDNLDTS